MTGFLRNDRPTTTGIRIAWRGPARIFETQADARPQALRVDSGDARTTNADLEARAEPAARHLLGRGV